MPIDQRSHDLDLSVIRQCVPAPPGGAYDGAFSTVAERLHAAKNSGASVILMMGAHVIRSGVQRHIIDLMRRKLLSCIAVNGAFAIHDFEFALIGATTESVARYISQGQFGLWQETGRINDIVNSAYANKQGLGEAIGRAISDGKFPHRDISVLAQAYALGVPVTVHVGIGYDILHEHPNCNGAALGDTSYRDFLRFAAIMEKLEGGLVMNFGSAIMAPEIYLKSLAMVRNAARQQGKKVTDIATLVCDLHDMPADIATEPARGTAAYFFRPHKTMLIRTVADGGMSWYVKGPHAETVPALWTAVVGKQEARPEARGRRPEVGGQKTDRAHSDRGKAEPRIRISGPAGGKIKTIDELSAICADLRKQGKRIALCHGCFDLMHPGHIKYFQAAKAMSDILIVTVTPDRYIDKGPDRPVYTEQLRAECIEALECVDFVAVNEWPTAEETLRALRPAYYVKGQEFEKLQDKTGKLQREYAVVHDIGAEMRFTHEIVFSSTRLINTHLKPAKVAGV